MYETIRIVEKLKPKYVVWENVKNVLSKKHRHNFENYLKQMENIGYTNYYEVLNAKDYGVPQNRERAFVVSILGNEHFEFPEKLDLKTRLKDVLEDNVEEKYYLSKDKIYSITHWKGFQKPFKKVNGKESIVPTITARGAGEEHNGMIVYSDMLNQTTNLQERFFGGDIHLRIRKLTPKECWRLMGFSDIAFEKAEKVNSNTQLYKQAGNSIVVNVLTEIFKKLFAH